MQSCWHEKKLFSDILNLVLCTGCRHIPRLYDFLWVAEDGMKMQGYNGSQLWDTTFAVQAICATGLAHEFTNCLQRAHHYVDTTQARTQFGSLADQLNLFHQ